MHKADTPCRELWRDGAEETAPQTLHVCFREQAFPSQCNAHWQLVPAPEKPSTGPKKRQTRASVFQTPHSWTSGAAMAPPGSQRSCTSGGPFTLLSVVCVCARMCAWVCTSVFVAVNAMTAAADPAANIWRPVSPTSSAAQAYAIHAGWRGFDERWQSGLVYAAAPIEELGEEGR